MERAKAVVRSAAIAATLLMHCHARADLRDDLGYTALKTELGSAVPTGAGISVAQIEANNGSGYFAITDPNPSTGVFVGKNFTFITSTAAPNVTYSAHAATVGQYFYSNDYSLAPGVTNVKAYALDGWREKVIHANTSLQPEVVPARVSNHSYLESIAIIPKFDWMAQTDDLLNVVAVANDFNADSLGLPAAFNGISVGRSDGHHLTGTNAFTGVYTAGRTAPLLVVPTGPTSYAAPLVSSAATSLIQYAHDNPSISGGSYLSPRSGGTIYHAETSEVIKAALLAGADRSAIGSYSVNTGNGLDSKYGAGQANIYDSYHILAGGEQNSQQAGRSADIGRYGFDYDSSFTQSESASYGFTADLTKNTLVASLVWNAKIAGGSAGNFDATATLYRFNLRLYDLADPNTPVAQSVSSTENTQNIFIKNLISRHKYILKVQPQSGQSAFAWDYALAWRLAPDDAIIDSNNHGQYILLVGDNTGDGTVDTFDVNLMISRFGLSNSIWDDGDFNGDGRVDTRDFSFLAGNFGASSAALPAGAIATASGRSLGEGSIVPEPASAVVLGLIAFCGLLRRRNSFKDGGTMA